MVGPADLARRLRELITALDLRAPRPENPAEAGIARDAAILRNQAVTRLVEITGHAAAAPAGNAARGLDRQSIDRTPFPAIPTEVAVLTVHEFVFDLEELDGQRVPSMERICRTFKDDANRALVWWIRFGALQAWCAGAEVRPQVQSNARLLRHAREAAASFPLNPRWEFDATAFGRAVDAIALTRARTGVDSAPAE